MSIRCDFRRGAGTVCGTLLLAETDRIGRVRFTCPACARRKAGICADCPRPVAGQIGKALRCVRCQKAAESERTKRWRARDLEGVRARAREIQARLRTKKRGGPPMPREEQYRRLGELRAAALTPERRREIARLGGLASAARRAVA